MKIILKNVREETWYELGGRVLNIEKIYASVDYHDIIDYVYDSASTINGDAVWTMIFEEICLL